jgi:hypothetical protein
MPAVVGTSRLPMTARGATLRTFLRTFCSSSCDCSGWMYSYSNFRFALQLFAVAATADDMVDVSVWRTRRRWGRGGGDEQKRRQLQRTNRTRQNTTDAQQQQQHQREEGMSSREKAKRSIVATERGRSHGRSVLRRCSVAGLALMASSYGIESARLLYSSCGVHVDHAHVARSVHLQLILAWSIGVGVLRLSRRDEIEGNKVRPSAITRRTMTIDEPGGATNEIPERDATIGEYDASGSTTTMRA